MDLNANGGAGSCSCPDHTRRSRDCKHLAQARQEAKKTAFFKSLFLKTDELDRQANRTDLRPEIRSAVALAHRCRLQVEAARNNPDLRV